MARKANPAVIGAFGVGAVALLVIGLVLFGSGRLFKHTQEYVIFFPGAVDGLSVGAPVRFKGVEVGSVKNIRLRLGTQKAVDAKQVAEGISIPVVVELDYDKITGQGGMSSTASVQEVKRLIDLGLRAQLNSQSLVTGLLFVQLDFVPDKPAVFVLPQDGDHLPEIPTIPTTLEEMKSAAATILQKLEDLHLERLVKSLSDAFDGANHLLHSPALQSAVDALPATISNVNEAVTGVRELVANVDRGQGPLIRELGETTAKTDAALEQARATLQTIQTLAQPSAPLASQLAASLQEISAAARAVRLLAEDLERNPSAIVRGKDVSNQ
jgi:paraquat-inducible protein B